VERYGRQGGSREEKKGERSIEGGRGRRSGGGKEFEH